MRRRILISSLILLFTAGFAAAATIHVPGAYPYRNLQQAINIAQYGDVIIIAPGTYIATAHSDEDVAYDIWKGITITGTDPYSPDVVAATVIDCNGQSVLAFDLHGSRSVLAGITIANSSRGYHEVADGIDPGDDGDDNFSSNYEPGIRIAGNHVIINCIIRNCRTDGGPGGNGVDGGIEDDPSDPNDPDTIYFIDGGNGGRGGSRWGSGIYIDYGSPIISNTVVEDCIATGGNGGNAGEGLDSDLDDPNLPGGAGGRGGYAGNAMGAGIYCDSGSSPTFIDCIIRNNQVYAGEGADGNDGGDGSIEEPNWVFPGGRGGYGSAPGNAFGGGVYVDNGVTATFTNCQFIDNRAYGANGGDGGDSGERHVSMDDERGALNGGHGGSADYKTLGAGVYIAPNAAVTFTGCTFEDNVIRGGVSGLGGIPSTGPRETPRKNFPAPTYGAGVYCAAGATATFTDCTVQGNWTTQEPNQYEGDLYPYGSHPSPDFQYAEVEYTGYGAGMCFVGGNYVELNHCQITDNNAPVGGGVFASTLTDFHVDDCDFAGNSAYLGGGLFSIDNFSTISGSTFTGNMAYDPIEVILGAGGGLFSFSTDVLISDCTFSENTTSGSGAGIYVAGDVAPPLTAEPVLNNCLITKNTAGIDGGGISVNWFAELDIFNCTIADNTVTDGYGGGLYSSYQGETELVDSIVWDNSADNGSQIAISSGGTVYPLPSTVTISYSDVSGGEVAVDVDTGCTLNWGAGNINNDPYFVGPLDGYYLSQTDVGDPYQTIDSPCVDTGSDYASNLGMNRYTTRTDNDFDKGKVDMGYHYPLLAELAERCASCDLFFDGRINFGDFEIFSNWFGKDCSNTNNWCQGADLTFDTSVDFKDMLFFAECWLAEDTTGPIPEPSQWEIEPYSTSVEAPYPLSMTAKVAVDAWLGDVQYYFKCESDSTFDSGWQSSPVYDIGGFAPDTEYGFRVRAKDGKCIDHHFNPDDPNYFKGVCDPDDPDDPNAPNKTGWSTIGYAVTITTKDYYAVICGIANYNDPLNDLYWTVNSAANLYRSLAHSANWNPEVVSSPENIVLIPDSFATKANIQAAIQDMATELSSGDVFLFYYTGHGSTGTDIDPIDEADGIDEYLFTYGATFDIEGNPQNAIRDDELGDWLAGLPTNDYIVILDTCFAGGHATGGLTPLGIGDNVPADGDGFAEDLLQMQPEGSGGGEAPMDVHDNGVGMVLAASDEGELSWESFELEHGVFTYYLLEGMDGIADQQGNDNDRVSGEESHDYLAPRVNAYLQGFGEEQHPQLYDADLANEFEFLYLEPVNPGFPASPSTLIAMAVSSSQINLLWLDRANNETGFEIERRIEDAAFVQLATVGANVEEYSDTELEELTRYTYRVRAYNAAGNSPFSREAYATTPEEGEEPPPPPDTTPPVTDPVPPADPYQSQWLIYPYEVELEEPNGFSWYWHSMTAVEATDESEPVEYYFECTAGLGQDSGWQLSPIYEYRVGSGSTICNYRVRARDSATPRNYGNWSTTESTHPF